MSLGATEGVCPLPFPLPFPLPLLLPFPLPLLLPFPLLPLDGVVGAGVVGMQVGPGVGIVVAGVGLFVGWGVGG